MTYYGGRELAASFRTVRKNTIQIAEEIPEDSYHYKVSEHSRTVGQTLAAHRPGARNCSSTRIRTASTISRN